MPLSKWVSDASASQQQKVPLDQWLQAQNEATIAQIDMLNSTTKNIYKESLSKQLRHNPTNISDALAALSLEVGTEIEKSFVMNEAMKDFGYRSALTTNAPDVPCVTKKRIVIDVNRCGLGNRILAVFSSIMLAVLTNRVLEVVWEANKYCGSTYDELFDPRSQNNLVMKVNLTLYEVQFGNYLSKPNFLYLLLFLQPLVYNNSKLEFDNIRSEFACHIRLDQSDWAHFYVLKDRELFDRLNANRDIIFLITNQLFHDILLDERRFGQDAKRLGVTFPHPFYDVARIAFQPKYQIVQRANEFIAQRLAGKRYLSIHSRGFYDGGKGLKKVFNCVNKLLANKDIDSVFFASESAKLNTLIYEYASNGTDIVTFDKIQVQDQVGNVDSQSIRNDMDSAMIEWYILGQAQYCMSSTIMRSTFSLTAIMRGTCKYIPYESGDSCDINSPERGFIANKEALLFDRETGDHINTLPEIDSTKRERIWDKIHKSPQLISEQCYDTNKMPLDSVLPYWRP